MQTLATMQEEKLMTPPPSQALVIIITHVFHLRQIPPDAVQCLGCCMFRVEKKVAGNDAIS
jgi:hypothetical protein